MSSGTRLVSLDVFRGLTMAAMVVVNNPGDWSNVYWPLLHAEWNGWTPTDLVFPFFLFIVGVSITLSQKAASWSSILRRAALILALGLFLAGYPRFDLGRWRRRNASPAQHVGKERPDVIRPLRSTKGDDQDRVERVWHVRDLPGIIAI